MADLLIGIYTARLDPSGRVNPWLGLGVGVELGSQSFSDQLNERSERTTTFGYEFLLTGALDIRLGRVFGLGPYGFMGIGSYTSTTTHVNGRTTFDGAIQYPTVHAWFGLGLRLVFLP